MVDRLLSDQILDSLKKYRDFSSQQFPSPELSNTLLETVAHFAARLEEEKQSLNTNSDSPSIFSDPTKYVELRREFNEMTGGKVDDLRFQQVLNLAYSVRDWVLVRGGEESLERKIQLGYPFDRDLPHKV